jgi:hypothetical protein
MLTREEVYQIVETERAYQDKTYNPNALLSSGQTRGARDTDVTPGLVLLDSYVRKAQDAWTDQKTGGSLKSLQQVAKIAAIAVRILERAGDSDELLNVGLR